MKLANLQFMSALGARLSRRARLVRASVTVLSLGLLVAGTLLGDDDAFPFGPFRMYSTSTPVTGNMAVVVLEARSAGSAWRQQSVSPWNDGVNRAEVEGQVPSFRAHPDLLRNLARAHTRLRPQEPRWTAVRVVMRYLNLRNREMVGTYDRVIAEWNGP